MSLLVQRVHGAIASIYPGRVAGECVIQGRTVATKQDWIFSFDMPDSERANGLPFVMDDGAWMKVRSVDDAGECETWCLRVEEDESFMAEGCFVKNCPLQLDLIERCITLWSNRGDVVFSPFMGIGSEGVVAAKLGRKFIGTELKESYWKVACKNLAEVEAENAYPDLLTRMGAA